MMDQEYQSLLAEQQTVQQILERIPAENVLDRDSFLARLEAIQAILAKVGSSPSRTSRTIESDGSLKRS